ncbi:MAG: outer membrane beta-barrel protein [bacterium]
MKIKIKIITFALVIVCIFSGLVNAQASKNFGILVGWNSSDISANNTTRFTQPKPGLSIYAFAEVSNSNFVSIFTEAGYVQKGFRFGYPENGKYEISYIETSVVFKFKKEWSKASIYIMTGPSISVNINENGMSLYSYIRAEKVSLGIKSGIGSELKFLSGIPLLAEVRFNNDFTNSINHSRNSTLEFLAGVRF